MSLGAKILGTVLILIGLAGGGCTLLSISLVAEFGFAEMSRMVALSVFALVAGLGAGIAILRHKPPPRGPKPGGPHDDG